MKKIIAGLLILCLSLSLCACEKASDDRIAGTVNGENIYFWEYAFFLNSVKTELLNQAGITDENEAKEFFKTAEIDGTKATEIAKNKAFEQTVFFKSKLHLANKANIKLDAEAKALINKQLQEIITSLGGKDEFYDALDEIGLTEGNYNTLLENTYLVDTYMNSLTENGTISVPDSEILKFYNENSDLFKTEVTAKHILFATIDPNTNAKKSEDEQKEAEQKAKDIYEKISSGSLDFDEAMKTYSEDPGLATNPDGYTFGRGEMVEIFETTAFNLGINEMSEPVLSDFGWHIILVTGNSQYPIDDVKESIKLQLTSKAFDTFVENEQKNFKITKDDNIINTAKF